MAELFAMPFRYFSVYVIAMTGANLLSMTVWVLLFGTMLGVLAWLARRHKQSPDWKRLAANCVFLAMGMNVSYQAMAGAVPAVRTVRFDARLLMLDRWLLGETPAVYLQNLVTPWLTEILSFCYIGFMPLLLFNLLRYFFRCRELLGRFYSGLFMVYGLGFLGYLLVPAAGPWVIYPELFNVELTGGPIAALNKMMVVQGSNRVDVWPSLHSAVSLFILGFAWRHHRKQFYLLLLPVAGLCISTLYLRYHYFIDVVSGAILAGFALYESSRYADQYQSSIIIQEEIQHDAGS